MNHLKHLLVVLALTLATTHTFTARAAEDDLITVRMLESVMDRQISGAVTLVAKNGEVVHHTAVGKSNLTADRATQKNDLFWIASMTKPITATAVLILQDEGKLNVNDPASKYLPSFKDVKLRSGDAPSRPITIRDLLTHTSGVAGPRGLTGNPTLAQIADAIAAAPLQFEPGSKWKYGSGLTVVGRIIEVVSGKPFETFLKERIFDPLGMKDTTFYPNAEQRKRLAVIYRPGKKKGELVAANAWFASYDPQVRKAPNPSGGLVSTATDMFRFYQMVLNGGELDGKRIVSKEAVQQMTTLKTGELVTGFTPGNGWGLGWCLVRQPQGVSAMLSPGTFGHGGAFGTQGWVDPKRKMIFVLMIARTGFGNSDGSKIRAAFQDLAVKRYK